VFEKVKNTLVIMVEPKLIVAFPLEVLFAAAAFPESV
jgi:hypothetical protein